MRKYLFLLLSFLCPFGAFAGAFLGASITYKQIGSIPGTNLYEIYVQLYRNCNTSIGFNNTLMVGIYKGDTLVANPLLDYISKTNLSPMPSGVCAEVGLYKTTVALPQITQDYLLEYQKCCWGFSVLNIYQSDQEGFTVTATIPPLSNSSPTYTQSFPMYAVLNQAFSYDMSATDTDNDISRYFLAPIYKGGTPNNPTPNPPTAPPFDENVFFPPYSLANMLSGTTPLTIDSVMGAMNAVPAHFGDFVVGIETKEYRNGTLLAKYRAAFVMSISTNLPSAIDIQTADDIVVYPNPATNNLFIHCENAKIENISCLDINGNTLFTTSEQHISVESMPEGIYVLLIRTEKGIIVKKWMKENEK